jgi:hypothetical protein
MRGYGVTVAILNLHSKSDEVIDGVEGVVDEETLGFGKRLDSK